MCLALLVCLQEKTEPGPELEKKVRTCCSAAPSSTQHFDCTPIEVQIGSSGSVTKRLKENHGGSLTRRAANYVRTMISEGMLQPGDRLPSERELAARLQMSRPSLRSGIAYLSAIGIVKIRPGVGTFVANKPSELEWVSSRLQGMRHKVELWHWFETGRLLETELAALAAERGRKQHIRTLGAEVAGMFATVNRRSDYLIHELRFHKTVARASGNLVLTALFEVITAGMSNELRKTAVPCPNLKVHAKIHHALYEAIGAGDGAEARTLLDSVFWDLSL